MPPISGTFQTSQGIYHWRVYRTRDCGILGVALTYPDQLQSALHWSGDMFSHGSPLLRLQQRDQRALATFKSILREHWPKAVIAAHWRELKGPLAPVPAHG